MFKEFHKEDYFWRNLKEYSSAQRKFIGRLRRYDIDTLTIDYDETGFNSQDAVKRVAGRMIDRETEYSENRLMRFAALEDWFARDLGIYYEEASKLSWFLWTQPEVLKNAKPYEPVQEYSKNASKAGVEEHIVSARNYGLSQVTYDSIAMHYPWIDPSHVKLTDRNDITHDPEFKLRTLNEILPDVHMDDSVSDIRLILKNGPPNMWILWFARELEVGEISHDRVICVSMEKFRRLMGLSKLSK
jgi:hypothetical protein